jgi:hypothetical protein
MNKLLIGLLVLAVAGGAFFLLKKKKNEPVTQTLNKEWIIGKWETNSYTPAADSIQPKLRFDFLKDGIALRSLSDSVKADTISYKWNDNQELVIMENATDSIGTVLAVSKLTADSLQVQRADSVTILFTKVK